MTSTCFGGHLVSPALDLDWLESSGGIVDTPPQSNRRHEQARLGSSTSSSIPHTVEYTTHTVSDCASPPHSLLATLLNSRTRTHSATSTSSPTVYQLILI
ncbi:hypothetical protein HBI93_094390 [Parastagonospora nodorum]|nr:hypothetical protein HBI94_086300 [Parastagonospora nodorum]KAH5835507.1 hypothetical protein HBI93_094390 [Parastagonospora nodorum]KAH5872327.1 hypothetical protein HBI90_085380 [Parastagonospora nodorum]KAH5875922.1 hypothetical protein HBI91_048350 [Parastagonospora nodorum]KAH5969819.1 hypothetical protein HBI85_077900 [Parastagonospora nodorum]